MLQGERRYDVEELIDDRIASVISSSTNPSVMRGILHRQQGFRLCLDTVRNSLPSEVVAGFYTLYSKSFSSEADHAAAVRIAYFQYYTQEHGHLPRYPLNQSDIARLNGRVKLPDRDQFFREVALAQLEKDLHYARSRLTPTPEGRKAFSEMLEREWKRELKLQDRLNQLSAAETAMAARLNGPLGRLYRVLQKAMPFPQPDKGRLSWQKLASP